MDRKPLLATLLEFGKLATLVGLVFGFCTGCLHLYAYLSSRADATEVAVLKAKHADDHEILMYIAHRLDDVASQFNHQALTGKVPYVTPPPAPPEVLGPVAAPKGNGP